jgi:hypothetical protein
LEQPIARGVRMPATPDQIGALWCKEPQIASKLDTVRVVKQHRGTNSNLTVWLNRCLLVTIAELLLQRKTESVQAQATHGFLAVNVSVSLCIGQAPPHRASISHLFESRSRQQGGSFDLNQQQRPGGHAPGQSTWRQEDRKGGGGGEKRPHSRMKVLTLSSSQGAMFSSTGLRSRIMVARLPQPPHRR